MFTQYISGESFTTADLIGPRRRDVTFVAPTSYFERNYVPNGDYYVFIFENLQNGGTVEIEIRDFAIHHKSTLFVSHLIKTRISYRVAHIFFLSFFRFTTASMAE